MHERLNYLYDCNCDTCKERKDTLKLAIDKPFKQVLNAAEKAFKKLHTKGSYKPDDLLTVKEYAELADKTAHIYDKAVTDNDIPPAMMQALKDDVFLFSALKTHAQLFEASRQLLTDDGQVKPFSRFSEDIKQLKQDYNRDYLEAEYQFAVTSAQMAGKWAATSDRYNLQYRTAGDDRVRQSHAQLNGITLPKDDPFWVSYYPPNGWRCRCNAIEVLKGKYEVSDSTDAAAKGETATSQIGKDGKNRLEIFRFNPGAQKVVFPPTHPYHKVQGAASLKRSLTKEGVEYRNRIYNKSESEQYSTIYKRLLGGKVQVHELVNIYAEDYNDVVAAAKAFAKQGKNVKLLPEININDKAAREKLLQGHKHPSSNPDLKVGNVYMDVKRPSAFKNITGNANQASKQGAVAVISDANMQEKFSRDIMDRRAKGIFSDENYKPDEVYFYADDKLHLYKRQKE